MKDGVLYLDVPYVEKDRAKKLGARWDAEEKKWYVPSGFSAKDFSEWIEEDEDN